MDWYDTIWYFTALGTFSENQRLVSQCLASSTLGSITGKFYRCKRIEKRYKKLLKLMIFGKRRHSSVLCVRSECHRLAFLFLAMVRRQYGPSFQGPVFGRKRLMIQFNSTFKSFWREPVSKKERFLSRPCLVHVSNFSVPCFVTKTMPDTSVAGAGFARRYVRFNSIPLRAESIPSSK